MTRPARARQGGRGGTARRGGNVSGWVGKGAVCVVRWARALARPTSIASSPPFASSRLCARVSLSSLLAFSRPLVCWLALLLFLSLSFLPSFSLLTPPSLSLACSPCASQGRGSCTVLMAQDAFLLLVRHRWNCLRHNSPGLGAARYFLLFLHTAAFCCDRGQR